MRAAILVLAGCGRLGFGSEASPDAATTGDASIVDAAPGMDVDMVADGPIIAADTVAVTDSASALCFGTYETICLATLPTGPLTVPGTLQLSTDGTSPCVATTAGTTIDACVLAGSSVDIAGTLTANGNKPLVILSTSTVSIGGKITGFAGHDGAGCGNSADGDQLGGGAGGSYAALGGAGGRNIVAQAAQPGAASAFGKLRGGCSGGNGSNGAAGGEGGAGVLIIGTSIAVSGRIDASGTGGQGGGTAQGGAGGGSGGLIALDAPAITFATSGVAIAQGGGGGAGGGTLGSGSAGQTATTPGVAAMGGTSSSGGAPGGGGKISGPGENGGDSTSFGAGGGGGSLGFIHATSTVTGGTLFPSPQ